MGLLGKDLSTVYSTLQLLCAKLDVEPPKPLASDGNGHANAAHGHRQADPATDESSESADHHESEVYELSPPASPSTVQAPIDPYLSSGHPHRDDATSATQRDSPRGGQGRTCEGPDLITKGTISQQGAEALVQRYLRYHDRFLYGIASRYRDADEVRRASPTLLAAMCAVAALEDAENRHVFDACYSEYRHLVSTSLFEKRGLEYIRALCIGSFWLLDTSRILLSDAIRRAADARLHRNLHRLVGGSTTYYPARLPRGVGAGAEVEVTGPPGDDAARDKLRLWYLLFVSDRHLSVLYNRDALIRPEKEAIEDRDSFLTARAGGTAAALNSDIRLISQTSLLVIMGQIRDVLGCERTRPLPKTFVVHFSHFNRELDQWFQKYSPSFEHDPHIGNFPLIGLTMHAHYARLYLGHHVFQGLADGAPIPQHFVPAAAAARAAAHDIFTMLLDSAVFRDNLAGMPHYFHIMISFAGHFLLGAAARRHGEQLDGAAAAKGPHDDLGRVAAALALLARAPVVPQHPVARVRAGLGRKLDECAAGLGAGGSTILAGSPSQQGEGCAGLVAGFNNGGGGGGGAEEMLASLDMQMAGDGLSDDFLLYGGFGDFDLAFEDPPGQYLS